MKFSIIISTLNNEETIEKTLQSIKKQEFEDYEIIVIDGGSSDRTLNLFNQFNFPNIKFVKQKGQGVYNAFNEGISLSFGEIIIILNADDFFEKKQALSIISDQFNIYKDIKLLMTNVKIFTKKNKLIRIYKSNSFKNFMFYFGHMPPHTGIFVKKEVYEKYGFFIEDFQNAGDFEFLLRVLMKKKIKYKKLKDYLVSMTYGGKSNKNIESFIKNTSEIKKALTLNGLFSSYLLIIIRFIIKVFQFYVR